MAITFNDNIQINAPKVLDNKYMKFAAGTTQPWANAAEAVTNILSAYRYQYLTVLCLMNGDPIEYWWRTGTADGNLETKGRESYTFNSSNSITLAQNYLYTHFIVLPTITITNLIIGTTNGGTDLEPGAAVSASTRYVLNYSDFPVSSTTIYFGNLTSGTKILAFKTFN